MTSVQSPRRSRLRCLVLGFAALVCAACSVQAGAFSVHPMRLQLGGTVRSAALTVRNDDAVPLSFQIRGMDWTQDAEGQDRYGDATDLVYFPRLLVLEPGQEAVIRVGLRQSLTAVEKTYRLFVEELPPVAAAPTAQGVSQIRALVRFGAPVFVKPAQPTSLLAIEALEVRDGQAQWRLRNAGNQHELFETLRVRGLDAQGAEVFATALTLRYLLAGSARRFQVDLPNPACQRLVRLTLEFKTDKSEAQRDLPLGTTPCP